MNLVATISILSGIAAYSAFLVFCIVNWWRGVTGKALLLAAAVTLLWMLTPVLPATRGFYAALEASSVATWIILLSRALGIGLRGQWAPGLRPVRWAFGTSLVLAAAAAVISVLVSLQWLQVGALLSMHLCFVVVNVLGLVLVEQLVQNTISDYRWRVRYLNIALGMLFSYGIVYHALSILFQTPALFLAVLQPAVLALMTPLIVIASLRNRTNQLRFSLSRHFLFRTGVLLTTGLFLLLLGLFGYLAQIFAGELGITIAVFLGIVAFVMIMVVVGSSRFRSHLRVVLSKAFFEFRYDYRDEWMKVTTQLTEPDADFDLPQQAQRSILSILHAKKSALWVIEEGASFRPLSHLQAPQWLQPLPQRVVEALTAFYAAHDLVLDLSDLPEAAARLDEALRDFPAAAEANYLVPLFVETRLFGICLVGPSEVQMRLSWEDYDILKLISKQCAGFIALQQANRSLIEQEQLSAVNQTSAFLLHDIKTIAAQMSLLLQNAEKHRDNPAFIDDMLSTTKNSVERMQRIIARLREPQPGDTGKLQDMDLVEWLRIRGERPSPTQPLTYQFDRETVIVRADPVALETALTQLEQNALEAIDGNGRVTVRVDSDEQWAMIHIIDNGVGMDETFIRGELFTPFRTTKGLSGMGIGAYQARDKIRQCGGDLHVESKVGVGSTFTIKLPLAA